MGLISHNRGASSILLHQISVWHDQRGDTIGEGVLSLPPIQLGPSLVDAHVQLRGQKPSCSLHVDGQSLPKLAGCLIHQLAFRGWVYFKEQSSTLHLE